MDFDYDLVLDDEFDAIKIESKRDFEAWSLMKYPARQHARKVAAELGGDEITDGVIYLPGIPTVDYEDSDQPPPLRQRRYFFYLTGANYHDCSVTYEMRNDRLTLWIPYAEPRQLLWFGSTPTTARAMQLFDIDEARYTSQLSPFLSARLKLKPSTTLFLLHQDQMPPLKKEEVPASIDSRSLLAAMDRARSVKDGYEIAMIRRANDVSSAAHRSVAERLLGLTSECEVEAIFQAVCTARGTRCQAYPIIAGAGANASTLHYQDNDQPLAGKELLVLDGGCEWNCYASDITRTLPISGRFSARAGAIHGLVQRMQETCIERVAPGVEYHGLHLQASAVALEGLLGLGILRGDAAEIALAGTVAAFFPHGLGHHVGLEVHDVSGDLPLLLRHRECLGLDRGKREMVSPDMLAAMGRGVGPRQLLQPNMVVTIEPGIYFCREYIEGYYLNDPRHSVFIDKDVLEQYYEVGGVRIEDDILVTEHGYENLTTAPKGEELLRVINAGKVRQR